MNNRQDLVTYMHRALGMSLSGNVSARQVFFCHGGGDNGKSVSLKTILHIAGDYGQRMQSSTLEAATFAKGGGGASDDIASLKGVRFACISEIEDGTRLASALLKDLTGDEKLTARHLYKSQFTFQPELHCWVAANHKPIVPADDQAVWNRLRLIPFDAVISESDKDPELGDKLKDEAPGILATLVRGCLEWQQDGLTTPKAVLEASASYRDEQDTFKDFLDYIADGNFVMTPSALRDTYNHWVRENTSDGAKMS
jgi:putative DNA primase/helicase